MNIAALISQWRCVCRERGIDPVAGATGYQVASHLADIARATHYQRQTAALAAYAKCHPGNFDNGYGKADSVKVERQCSRQWWVYSGYWRGAGVPSVVVRQTEIEALKALRSEALDCETRGETFISAIRVLWREERERLTSVMACYN